MAARLFFAAMMGFCVQALAADDYKGILQNGILGAENATVETLVAFASPATRNGFCLSFETRAAQIDVDSEYRILRDRDAEEYLPQVEKMRQDEVKASLGLKVYNAIESKLAAALQVQSKLVCESAQDQAALKNLVIKLLAQLISAHGQLEVDSAALYSVANQAHSRGLLSDSDLELLKKLVSI